MLPYGMDEMSSIPKRVTGLPVNLWVEEKGNSVQNQHNLNRVKFQNSYGNSVDKSALVPIGLESLDVLIKNKNIILSAKELRQIKEFIIKYDKWFSRIFDPNDDYDAFEFNTELKSGKI
jgi:hypothetical protein